MMLFRVAAHGTPNSLHTWVGIIMYLPTEDVAQRSAITAAFKSYADKTRATLGETYGLKTHWAKIEVPPIGDESARRAMRDEISRCASTLCVQRLHLFLKHFLKIM